MRTKLKTTGFYSGIKSITCFLNGFLKMPFERIFIVPEGDVVAPVASVFSHTTGELIAGSRDELPNFQAGYFFKVLMIRGDERVVFPQRSCRHKRIDCPQSVR